ncbi:hypothetical protein ACSYAD_30445 [Acaryochloris marina NIES-2412]|uniref:hypothetical protein n=1 Tax=Acaryochloris marina TaxID=155978 RepID=UPI0040591C57
MLPIKGADKADKAGNDKTVEDVTGFFNQTQIHQTQQGSQIPKLDDWIELVMGNRIVISGVISNHSGDVDGQRILICSIRGLKKHTDGSIYAFTRHSRFKLGQRLGQC